MDYDYDEASPTAGDAQTAILAGIDELCHRQYTEDSVKAVSINISLNPDLAEFAKSDAEAGAFDSMSEYMRELIRRRREARITEDVSLLENAMAGAPVGDPSRAEMRRIYGAVKKRRK